MQLLTVHISYYHMKGLGMLRLLNQNKVISEFTKHGYDAHGIYTTESKIPFDACITHNQTKCEINYL